MIASLYQSCGVAGFSSAVRMLSATTPSPPIALTTRAGRDERAAPARLQSFEAEDVDRLLLRVEQDPAGGALPGPPRVGQQVVDDVAAAIIEAEYRAVEVDPAGLRVERIEIDDDQQAVRAVRADLAVGQDLLVIGVVEGDIRPEVQGGILVPDLIHPPD